MAELAGGVTVAVVVKDRRDRMAACLDGIAAQRPEPAEVVVVDNGSTDGTWELLRERADGWPALRVTRDGGSLGRIRNLAVTLARGDVIAFTDSDCVPSAGWLRELVRPFADGSIGVVQGRTVPAADITARWSATQRIEAFSRLYEACNIAYRRRPLAAAGGFDEEIGFFGEDTVAGWRMHRIGWRAAWAPEAVVEHDVTYPGAAWHLRRAFGYGNWNRLVREFPELRHEVLWRRWWLTRRTATFDLAVLGAAAAAVTRRPWPALPAAPYLLLHRQRRPGVSGLADAAAGVAYDAARAAGLVTGCIRHRTVVL